MKRIAFSDIKVFWNRIKLSVGIILGLFICGWPVFILYIPNIRNSWDLFFTYNTKILDIYWQTLLILLTILIPVMVEILKSLTEKFPNFGARIFFLEIVHAGKFYALIPFSFLLFFAVDHGVSPALLSLTHYILFVLWVLLFWQLFQLLEKSVLYFIDSGNTVNEYFEIYLRRDDLDFDIELDKWNSLWETIGTLKSKWQFNLLSLFWWKQERLMRKKEYELLRRLFESFFNLFLSLGNDEARLDIQWINIRKRWLWFHDEKFSDKTENPHAIVWKLLNYHFETYKLREGLGNADQLPDSKEMWVYGLYSLITDRLEKIFEDELKKTDDYYYGLFKCLRSFFLKHRADGDKYLSSVPIYRVVFDNVNHFNLYDYSPDDDSGFPAEWRILEKYLPTLLDNSFESVQRRLWINGFMEWFDGGINRNLKKYNHKMDCALSLLFPEAYQPWMAFALGYRFLSWSGSRILSLCAWEFNFGQMVSADLDGHFNDSLSEQEQSDLIDRQRDSQIERQKMIAAKIIAKIGLMGTRSDIAASIKELEELASQNDSIVRVEVLKMLRAIERELKI